MSENNYSKNIADAIRNVFIEEGWDYSFDEQYRLSDCDI